MATALELRQRHFFRTLLGHVCAKLAEQRVNRVFLLASGRTRCATVYRALHFVEASSKPRELTWQESKHQPGDKIFERAVCAKAAAAEFAARGGAEFAARGGAGADGCEPPRAAWKACKPSKSGAAGASAAAALRAAQPQQPPTEGGAPKRRTAARPYIGEVPEAREDDAAHVEGAAPKGWPADGPPFVSGPVTHVGHISCVMKRRSLVAEVRPITVASHPCRGQHGLFATALIRKGAFICTYGGMAHLSKDADAEGLESDYAVNMAGITIDAALCGSEGRYANDFHVIAARPNADYQMHNDFFTGTGWMAVHAVRDIMPGEEITCDYGTSWWDAKNKRITQTAAAGGAIGAAAGTGLQHAPNSQARKWCHKTASSVTQAMAARNAAAAAAAAAAAIGASGHPDDDGDDDDDAPAPSIASPRGYGGTHTPIPSPLREAPHDSIVEDGGDGLADAAGVDDAPDGELERGIVSSDGEAPEPAAADAACVIDADAAGEVAGAADEAADAEEAAGAPPSPVIEIDDASDDGSVETPRAAKRRRADVAAVEEGAAAAAGAAASLDVGGSSKQPELMVRLDSRMALPVKLRYLPEAEAPEQAQPAASLPAPPVPPVPPSQPAPAPPDDEVIDLTLSTSE